MFNTVGNLKVSLNPYIVFSREVLESVRYLVRNWDLELQWFHTVTREVRGNDVYYIIDELFVTEQECSGAEVEAGGHDQLEPFWRKLKEERGLSLPELGEIMSKTTCWSHSHVNMVCAPSGTDNKQWKKQKKLSYDDGNTNPQIMMIVNKKDDLFNRVHDSELGFEMENVPVLITEAIDHTKLDNIIKTKLKKRKPKFIFGGSSNKLGAANVISMDSAARGPTGAAYFNADDWGNLVWSPEEETLAPGLTEDVCNATTELAQAVGMNNRDRCAQALRKIKNAVGDKAFSASVQELSNNETFYKLSMHAREEEFCLGVEEIIDRLEEPTVSFTPAKAYKELQPSLTRLAMLHPDDVAYFFETAHEHFSFIERFPQTTGK